MTATVTRLPWVKEVGDGFIPVKTTDFEEMRAWAERINDAYLTMVNENVRLQRELRELKGERK